MPIESWAKLSSSSQKENLELDSKTALQHSPKKLKYNTTEI